MQQKITTPIAKGLVIGLIMIMISTVIAVMGENSNTALQWLVYLVFIGGIIWAISSYGKQVNYNSTFGNYFAHGFKISAIVTILMIIFLIIFMMLFPDFKEKAMAIARTDMASKNYSAEDTERGIEIANKFFTPLLIGSALLTYLILGCIASLIGAAITKKNPRPLDEYNEIGQ